ncbi:MAG: hypothetical protein ACLRZ9_12420 [Eubacterium sp.]
MEFIFEIIFEAIFEGVWELGTSKKVCMPVRIVMLLMLIAIYGGIVLLCFFMAISGFKENNVLFGVMGIILGIVIAVIIVYGFIKKCKEHKSE